MKTIQALAALQAKTREPWEATINRMAENGFSLNQAARAIGINSGTLHAFLRVRGITPQWSHIPPNRHTVDGVTGTIAHLCREFGANQFTVYQRIRRGAEVNRHLFRPAESSEKETFTVGGVTGNMNSLAKKHGLSRGAVSRRMKSGESIEQALARPAATHTQSGHLGQAALQQKLRKQA